ncbi:MAG: putative lipid II flippase FtsW [Acidimicrobiia bacterium]|nr:putative lipid II flippase FtsW [Acidimicrobiia bacterium]
MSARVTSITSIRTAARRRESARSTNSRLVSLMLVIVGILAVIGLGATLSASSVPGLLSEANDNLVFFKRQIMWVVLGAITMFVASRVPYDWYRRLALPIFTVSVAGLIAVLLFGIEQGGATSWIDLGPVALQPSEFAKFGTIVFLATVFTRKGLLLSDFNHFLVPVAATAGLTGLLVILEKDLGTTIIVGAAVITVLISSEAPLLFTFTTGLVGSLVAAALTLGERYRRERILCFLDPFSDPLGDCYQLGQSLLALGSGQMFGVGLGASRARWSYLPNAHTDFIFAIMGEETGFAGALMILLLFCALTVIGIVVSHRAPDSFGRMLAAGITGWLAAQAIVNIGGVVGIMPITGLPLPFVSVGGSALLTAMGAAGVLMNIAHSGKGKVTR